MAYKKDQGRMARMAAFWSLAILIFYGCVSLHTEVSSLFPEMGKALGGFRIPILGMDFSPAFIISGLVLGTSLWLLYRWQDKPKNADLLIETESELRKVTWPSLDEAINGSVVVIICVLFLMAYLASADWFLGRAMTVILLGRG
jgi:preprotein translocase SecE subunit